MEVSGPVIKREPRGKSALNLVMVTKKGRRAQPRARANNHVNKPTGQHRPSPAPLSAGGWHRDNTGRAPTSGNPPAPHAVVLRSPGAMQRGASIGARPLVLRHPRICIRNRRE